MERLFLSVLHTGITAGYLILAVATARLLLKKAPKGIVCMLWIVVGLRLLCPFRIETPFGMLPAQTKSFLEQAGNGSYLSQEPETMPLSPNQKSETNAFTASKKQPAYSVTAAAAWVWLAGCTLMLAYLLLSWLRMKKRVETAVPAESQGIRFYQCGQILSPFLFGLAAPKIYVPFSVTGQDLLYVLKHEEAHKRRYDHVTKLAGYVLLAVYWFQPLVWAAYVLFCTDLELACDERVVREIGEGCKKAYSQALLSCSAARPSAPVYPVAFGEIGVKNRVKNILNYKKPGILIVAAAAVVCVIVTACFTTESKGSNAANIAPEGSLAGAKMQAQSIQAGKTADAGGAAKLAGINDHVTAWAEAYCGRQAEVIYRMLDQNGRKRMEDQGMLEGKHSFGWSSPWPWGSEEAGEQPNYRVLSVTDTSAVILYYAWTSDPHVTVWRQEISYRYSEKKKAIAVSDVSNDILDNIETAGQFYAAYPNGEISHTRMDYTFNGAGEALNQNGMLDSSWVFKKPDAAALYLLNISSDPALVKTEVLEQNGEAVVTMAFLKDGGSARVRMVRLFGEEHNIWVPKTAD